MNNVIFLPHHRRIIAVLFGIIGGALDVYCQLKFGTLVALQTGNIIFLISDIQYGNMEGVAIRCLSVLFFTLGFWTGMIVERWEKTPYWRAWNICPFLVVTLILPVISCHAIVWVALLAYTAGIVMISFRGIQIESEPYSLFMTSGNYQRMLISWYHHWRHDYKHDKMKRQAVNYSIMVSSFVAGALIAAAFVHFFDTYAVWFIAICTLVVLSKYAGDVRALEQAKKKAKYGHRSRKRVQIIKKEFD